MAEREAIDADIKALDEPTPTRSLRSCITALADSLETGLDGQPNMAGRFIAEELRRIMAESSDGEPAGPRVTQRQLDMMRHATGRRLDRERNHYCAVPDTDPYADWEELVSMGLAVRSDVGEGPATYQVTEAGFRMVYGAKRRKR